jgi:hypothetical protein
MYLSEEYDNKREDKHTARQLPNQYHVPQTRSHAVSGSQLHHQCAARLHPCRCLRSDEEHRPYSARHLQTRRDGKAPHRAYNAQDSRVVGLWVPRRLKRPHHEIYSVPAIAGVNEKRTKWDVKLGGELDRLAYLNNTACGRIVPETLEMEDENWWKRFDEHLMACLAQARWGVLVLHGLRLGDAHESVLNRAHRIRL